MTNNAFLRNEGAVGALLPVLCFCDPLHEGKTVRRRRVSRPDVESKKQQADDIRPYGGQNAKYREHALCTLLEAGGYRTRSYGVMKERGPPTVNSRWCRAEEGCYLSRTARSTVNGEWDTHYSMGIVLCGDLRTEKYVCTWFYSLPSVCLSFVMVCHEEASV